MSRTPPGVRELKHSESSKESRKPIRRTPPGVRELKQMYLVSQTPLSLSHPSRGA